MFDLQALAFQSDLTRVTTFMLGREFSARTFPEIGIFEAHHPLSHHQNDPVKIEKITKLNTFHMSLFASYLEKLRSTPDGDGSLFDHSVMLASPMRPRFRSTGARPSERSLPTRR